jgi:putative sterol carrier protein
MAVARVASTEWFGILGDMLNEDPAFTKKAQGFTADIVFVADEERKTAFPIVDGTIGDVRAAVDGDVDEVEFVIECTPQVWADLQSGKLGFRIGMMMNRIKLVKGNDSKLLKYFGAATVMFETMKRVPTDA